jgi:hypothetical protein
MLIIVYLKFLYLTLFFNYFKLSTLNYFKLFLIIPPLAILNYCNLSYSKIFNLNFFKLFYYKLCLAILGYYSLIHLRLF